MSTYPHRTQFTAGTDLINNANAALLVEKLTEAGYSAELVEDVTAVDHVATPEVLAVYVGAIEGAATTTPEPPAPAPEPEPEPEPDPPEENTHRKSRRSK